MSKRSFDGIIFQERHVLYLVQWILMSEPQPLASRKLVLSDAWKSVSERVFTNNDCKAFRNNGCLNLKPWRDKFHIQLWTHCSLNLRYFLNHHVQCFRSRYSIAEINPTRYYTEIFVCYSVPTNWKLGSL